MSFKRFSLMLAGLSLQWTEVAPSPLVTHQACVMRILRHPLVGRYQTSPLAMLLSRTT